MEHLQHFVAQYWAALQADPRKLHLMMFAIAAAILAFLLPLMRITKKTAQAVQKPLSFASAKRRTITHNDNPVADEILSEKDQTLEEEVDLLALTPEEHDITPLPDLRQPERTATLDSNTIITPVDEPQGEPSWTNHTTEKKGFLGGIFSKKPKTITKKAPEPQREIMPDEYVATRSILRFHTGSETEDPLAEIEIEDEPIDSHVPNIKPDEKRIPTHPHENIVETEPDDYVFNDEPTPRRAEKSQKNIIKTPWDEDDEIDIVPETNIDLETLREETAQQHEPELEIEPEDTEIEIEPIMASTDDTTKHWSHDASKEISVEAEDIELETPSLEEEPLLEHDLGENNSEISELDLEPMDEQQESEAKSHVTVGTTKPTNIPTSVSNELHELPFLPFDTEESEDVASVVPSTETQTEASDDLILHETKPESNEVELDALADLEAHLSDTTKLRPADNQVVVPKRSNPRGIGFVDTEPHEFGDVDLNFDEITTELDKEQKQGIVPTVVDQNEDSDTSEDDFESADSTEHAMTTTKHWPTLMNLQSGIGQAERENLLLFIGDMADADEYLQVLVNALEEETPDGLRPLVLRVMVESYCLPALRSIFGWIVETKDATDEEKSTARRGLTQLDR